VTPRSDGQLSRRQALRRLAGLAATATPVAGRLGGAEARGLGPPLTGRVVTPSDPEYDTARFDDNKRFDVFPVAIAYCRGALDVSHAVLWARARKVPISVRSGGHSYEAFSIGPGLVIDLTEMNQVAVDPARGMVVAQPGIRLLEFYRTLSAHGVTVPGGTCASVGLGGLTLGGGVGFLTRKWGLTSDNVRRVELVLASGQRVTASETDHSDLLWACRGGGGSFGIVTALHLEARPIGEVAIFECRWPFERAAAVLAAWQQQAPFWPDELTASLEINGTTAGTVTSEGIWLGSQAALRELLQPLLSAAPPERSEVSTMPFVDAATRFSDESTVPYFKAKSDYARGLLSLAAIETIVHFMATSPTTDASIQFQAYGGAVNRVPADASAFPHRDTLFSLQYLVRWSDPSDAPSRFAWIGDFHAAMWPYVSGGAYSNMCDVDLDDWPRAYYGDNFPRLVDVKRRYDPHDVFHFAQSIPIGQP
jgi:FAD/FMN-containing dehydrogenase